MSQIKKFKVVYFILISLLFISQAEARRNQNREVKQENRINQGVQSGSLNKREAHRLERGQNRVDKAQENAMSDGQITKKEKVKLEKMQDRQSKRIYRQKHDQQKAN